LQDNDTRLTRCHFSCFRANHELLGNLFVPKGGNGERYAIKCIIGAYNNVSGEAYVYLEMKQPVRAARLEKAILDTGGAQIIINTFSASQKGVKRTYDDECSAALFSVHEQSKEPGFKLIPIGTAWVEPKEMTPVPEAHQEDSIENHGGLAAGNFSSIDHLRERVKRSRSVDAADVLEFLMRQEKRQTVLEEQLSAENKESEKNISRYEKIIDRYEDNPQAMEAKIKKLEAINAELTSKNDKLMQLVENTVPKE
jgi:hypothetical protein